MIINILEKIKKDGLFITFNIISSIMFAASCFLRVNRRSVELDFFYLVTGMIWAVHEIWMVIRAVKKHKVLNTEVTKNNRNSRIFTAIVMYLFYLQNVYVYILSSKILE